jgi:beta-alanine degradation protein BauB
MGQDPIEVAPNVYTVLFENDRVRLLDVRVRPGDGSEMHSHPDYLVYNLTDSRVAFSDASGQTQEVELKAGDVMWREAEDHAARNPGDTELRALLFELK